MLNQIALVGRIAQDSKIKELENGNKVLIVTLSVPRAFKNINGEYDNDLIDCTLWNYIAENTNLHKGDLLAVRGRLQKDDGDELKVIAEKVTFLATRRDSNE